MHAVPLTISYHQFVGDKAKKTNLKMEVTSKTPMEVTSTPNFLKILRALFSCYFRFEIRPLALSPTNSGF